MKPSLPKIEELEELLFEKFEEDSNLQQLPTIYYYWAFLSWKFKFQDPYTPWSYVEKLRKKFFSIKGNKK